jgi:hypothetical protein
LGERNFATWFYRAIAAEAMDARESPGRMWSFKRGMRNVGPIEKY